MITVSRLMPHFGALSTREQLEDEARIRSASRKKLDTESANKPTTPKVKDPLSSILSANGLLRTIEYRMFIPPNNDEDIDDEAFTIQIRQPDWQRLKMLVLFRILNPDKIWNALSQECFTDGQRQWLQCPRDNVLTLTDFRRSFSDPDFMSDWLLLGTGNFPKKWETLYTRETIKATLDKNEKFEFITPKQIDAALKLLKEKIKRMEEVKTKKNPGNKPKYPPKEREKILRNWLRNAFDDHKIEVGEPLKPEQVEELKKAIEKNPAPDLIKARLVLYIKNSTKPPILLRNPHRPYNDKATDIQNILRKYGFLTYPQAEIYTPNTNDIALVKLLHYLDTMPELKILDQKTLLAKELHVSMFDLTHSYTFLEKFSILTHTGKHGYAIKRAPLEGALNAARNALIKGKEIDPEFNLKTALAKHFMTQR